ncbi:MAG: glycosyltransferase family 4 protein [Pseudomonadota bacterium]
MSQIRVAVIKDRYQSSFMSPRQSRHVIDRRQFVPFNKIRNRYDGFTMLAPGRPVDLVHAHNRLPVGAGKMIVSFESHMPRRYAWPKDNMLTLAMQRIVESNKCRRLIGMSHFAKRLFLKQHENSPNLDLLTAKLMVRHPNLEIPDRGDRLDLHEPGPLKLVFVGADFGRKGGCVAARMAQLAHERSLPVHITFISALTVGNNWIDPSSEGFFDPYLKAASLPTATFVGAQPSAVVKDVLGQSHFSLLHTFADTFGYSAIEAMAEHTPVIGTRLCALPEFITDGVNGFLLDVDATPEGEWTGIAYSKRHTADYGRGFAEQVDRLAEETLARLEPYFDNHLAAAPLRMSARHTAEQMFDAQAQASAWDALYEWVAAENVKDAPRLDVTKDWSSRDQFASSS